MSMGVFELNSKRLNKIYKARDDNDSHVRGSISISASPANVSKTEDELFQLRFPSIGSPTLLTNPLSEDE